MRLQTKGIIMQLWKRYMIVGTFFFLYAVLALYMATVSPDCASKNNNQPNPLIQASNSPPKDSSNAKGVQPPNIQNNLFLKSFMSWKENSTTFNKSDNKRHIFEIETLTPDQLLVPNQVPSFVFYVWCGRRWLEFPTYLSIKSVIRTLKPDNLVFFYDSLPVIDSWLYNTWFKELKEEYPFFIPTEVKPEDGACQGFNTVNLDFIYKVLQQFGGLYMYEYTILDSFPIDSKHLHFMYGLFDDGKYAFVQCKPKVPIYDLIQNPLLKGYKTKQVKCQNYIEYNRKKQHTTCVRPPNSLFPKDIWEMKKPFGDLVRRHFYGSPHIKLPQRNYEVLIPNIAHIVWIGGGEMDFLFYLGVVSLIYVAEVDVVYIHGNLPPRGPYWQRIVGHPKVKHIYRAVPKTVFGTQVNVLSHITDVWRVDFMVKYGGIYVDTDVAFVRKLDRDIRAYDAVGTYDWTYWNHPFPDTINFGVAIGKKGAKYWHHFQESMKWFIDSDWAWNGLRQPYKIKERHPELVLINPHLQITCFMFKCHPTWWPNYHNESIHHLNSESIKDWKNEAYAFHWTMPTPPELENEEALVNSNTMFADIGRYILHKAGILKPDNRTLVYPNGKEIVLNIKKN